jgi:hypothetical protein
LGGALRVGSTNEKCIKCTSRHGDKNKPNESRGECSLKVGGQKRQAVCSDCHYSDWFNGEAVINNR